MPAAIKAKKSGSFYAPRGLETNKPVTVRLMPDEREAVQTLATRDGRTLSNMCRQLVLRGLQKGNAA